MFTYVSMQQFRAGVFSSLAILTVAALGLLLNAAVGAPFIA